MGPCGAAVGVTRVYVYRNLHTGTWSVRALDGSRRGRVVAHPRALVLVDAVFRVSAAGRERVRATGVRCVHAGVVGRIARASEARREGAATEVTYNPFRHEGFVALPGCGVVERADVVAFPEQPRAGSRPLLAWGASLRATG